MVAHVDSPIRKSAFRTQRRVEFSTLRHNLKCFVICLLVAVSYFQYGFDTAVVNGFQASQGFLRVFGTRLPNGQFTVETTFQQLITSLLQVGLIIAAVLMGPFSNVFGRRMGFLIASIFAFIGISIQISVTTKGPVYVGRLLLGIANGMYITLTVLYISEVAPAHLRGLMVSVFQTFLTLGSFIGALVSNALHNNLSKQSYQIQLAILYFVPLWLVVVMWYIPESPRWLAVQGRQNEAASSLARLRPSSTPLDSINAELYDICEAIRAEKKLASSTKWMSIWKRRDLRRTMLVIACTSFHPACGVNLLVSYGTFFFQTAGTGKPFVNTIILQAVSFVTSLFALPLARRFGRRPLLLTGFGITTISMFGVAIVSTVDPTAHASGRALVALLCVFLGSYGTTIGPLSWVAAGEMPTNRLRSHTFGTGMGVGFVFAWLTTFTTPFFINATQLNWGGKVAWIWAPSNLITMVFIYLFLPETKGRTLEELDELFYNDIPARKFKEYQCNHITLPSAETPSEVSYDKEQEKRIESMGIF